YRDVATAQTALRTQQVPIVVGALPFDMRNPAALLAPRTVQRTAALPAGPDGPLPAVRVAAMVPTPAQHRERVRRVIDRLAAPGGALHKVVLARAVRLVADAPLDAGAVLRRLVDADPSGYGYLVDLTSAGPPYGGQV